MTLPWFCLGVGGDMCRDGRRKREVVVRGLSAAAWRWLWVVVVFLRAVLQWVPPLTPPKGPRNPIKVPHRPPGPSRGEERGR